jgi:hypothetical protein
LIDSAISSVADATVRTLVKACSDAVATVVVRTYARSAVVVKVEA